MGSARKMPQPEVEDSGPTASPRLAVGYQACPNFGRGGAACAFHGGLQT